jgi:hypothetical protein
MAKTAQRVATVDRGAAVVGFDYESVVPERRRALQDDAREIRKRLIDAAGALVDIGERLRRARELLPHGAWLPWLVAETGMSEQWARDCVNLYLRFGDRRAILEELNLALSPTAIVRLATAPEAACEDVLGRARKGETLRVTDVEETIKRHRDRERESSGKGPVARAYADDGVPVGADALRILADRARDELIPLIVARAQAILGVLEDAEQKLADGKTVTQKSLEVLRPDAQWLTDALEQLSQRRAAGDAKVVHLTYLDREPLDNGPWTYAASFLRGISSSDAIQTALRGRVPEFVEEGTKALRRALLR